MLEESHAMLAQLRDTLEKEKAERLRVAGLLEHEQQRTQLLLDVLKHFKEKLQGLTPQVLLGRLGADPKAIFGRDLFDEKPLGPAVGPPVGPVAGPPVGAGTPGAPCGVAPPWLTPSPHPKPSPCASGWSHSRPFEVPAAPMVTPPGAMV